jgi:hypothetical protein
MLGNLIEKQESLPDGIVIVDKKLGRLLKTIQSLESQDMHELEAFVSYLAGGSENLDKLENQATTKIYDFMTGGMQLAV